MARNSVDPDLLDLIDKAFSSKRTVDGTDVQLDRELWSVLGEAGLARLTGAESSGGSGAGWVEAAALLSALGFSAAQVPVAEHDLLAGFLLEQAGLPFDDGVYSAGVFENDADSDSLIVPWASEADRIVLLRKGEQWQVTDLPTSALVRSTGKNLASEPRDRVAVDINSPQFLSAATAPVREEVVDEFRLRGALARSVMICGAMDRVLDICVEHTTTRTQFGRSLSKFQAVQALVADIATESALARAAAENAVAVAVQTRWHGHSAAFAVAVAKSTTGHAASTVARRAHQCLGAIGFTMEHDLHRYTNRMLSWRSEFGSVRYWDERIAEVAVAAGGKGVWSLIEGG
jgi:acyl-CoA dehydrogenase